MARPRPAPQSEVAGLPARRVAADIIDGVLHWRRPLDEQLSGKAAHPGLAALAERDRALMRRIVGTTLRRLGTLQHLLGQYLERGFPADAPRVESVLLTGAAQVLWLDVPDHAAVDLSVRLIQADRRGGRYAGLINAVLRRIAREAPARLVELDAAALDVPAWLLRRWERHYGADTARVIARAIAQEPPLDLTVKRAAETWAARLRGKLLPTGTVRTVPHGPVSLLPGFAEGAWWVQDAAAALPARLFGAVENAAIADLCAAPGGKTAQLALAGARVTAVDRAPARLDLLRENLDRLGLEATVVAADATEWQGGPFDGVLVDAPCSSTGTIRRHPDIPWLKREADIAALADLQGRLLQHAVALTRPGGTIVYCTCSLEPEEGEAVVAALLARRADVIRRPIAPEEVDGLAELLTPEGDLRTLPCHLPDSDPRLAGMDGFYAARLQKAA